MPKKNRSLLKRSIIKKRKPAKKNRLLIARKTRTTKSRAVTSSARRNKGRLTVKKRLKNVNKPLKLTFAGTALAGVILLVGLTTGLLSSFLSLDKNPAHAIEKPNIVLIMTDDQPALDGRLIDFMPTVKSMFKDQGVTFSDFHSESPLCCPARAGTLTGQHTHNHGVDDNKTSLFNPRMTIATQMRTVGYYNMLVGKYMNQYDGCSKQYCAPNVPPGWDRWAAFGDPEYYNYNWYVDGNPAIRHGSNPADYSTDVIASAADSFIRGAPTGQPIMAFIAPNSPHKATIPAPRHQSTPCPAPNWKPANWNEADVSDKPAYVRSAPLLPGNVGTAIDKTCRGLLSVDELVAKVKTALADTGRLDNTMFIFSGDNGMNVGEHRLTAKSTPYQTEIPFYVYWPSKLGTTPRTVNERVQNIDLASTICELTGCIMGPYPKPAGQVKPDGKSFLQVLLGDQSTMGRDAVLDEFPKADKDTPAWYEVATTSESPLANQGCVKFAEGGCRWRYVEYNTGEKELYDVSNGPCWSWSVGQDGDPCELQNQVNNPLLATIKAALATRLSQLKAEKGT